ncbi:helix-turn-helix domain-containing protein [Halogranum amylolyticum]|uniref:helix-turn-helix domain-containing protein n=1 Tax=Halogranum amylolyticum TaxID=660520 RepID=UPI00147A89FD|nr:helix-turn-helix domain-containing protein [Halogranum amylolyticum]
MIAADLRLDTPLLATVFETVPDVVVAVDRMYATDDESVLLHCRVTADAFGPFERALAEADDVSAFAALTTDSDSRRYRISLVPAAVHTSTYRGWVDCDGMLLEARRSDEEWTVRLALPSREALCSFRDYCAEHDLRMDLRGLSSYDAMNQENRFGLTEPQRDILLQAIKLGYFDIPRSASLAELGESLGITGQAASERLRRALKSLLETSLDEDGSVDSTAATVEG